MNMKKLITSVLFLITLFTKSTIVKADFDVVTSSATLKNTDGAGNSGDPRVAILGSFLESKGSPLVDFADEFVKYADMNNLDWRLVPSITGVESSFGKRIPQNSYNAYGWANGNFSFESWDNSISHVSKTLNEKYYNKGATNINKIARRYAPPSSSWAGKVKYFMKKIDPIPVTFDL